MVENFRVRGVEAAPSGDPGSKSQLCVIAIGEEIFVEPTDQVQHLTAVHRRASIRPDNLFDAVELAAVELAGAPATVLAVQENEMTCFVYSSWIVMDEDFGGGHSNVWMVVEHRCERLEPARIGLGVVVEKSDEVALGDSNALVVGGAEATVVVVADDAARGEVALNHFYRSVGRAVVDYDHFEWGGRLACEGREAEPE